MSVSSHKSSPTTLTKHRMAFHLWKARKKVLNPSSGKNSSPDVWKKKLADVTGTRYKPRQQEEEAWEDTSGVYDTDGNLLSVEDYANDNDGALVNSDEWIDDFDNNEGLVEDQEIFNMDTGWSIEDFVADAPAAAVADHKVHPASAFSKAVISLLHKMYICQSHLYCA